MQNGSARNFACYRRKMTRIASVATALPENVYSQSDITAELASLIPHDAGKRAVLERVHGASGIATRHTALPLERYRNLGTFGETNDIFIEVATDLAEKALAEALERAGLTARDVDFIMFTSDAWPGRPGLHAFTTTWSGIRTTSAC